MKMLRIFFIISLIFFRVNYCKYREVIKSDKTSALLNIIQDVKEEIAKIEDLSNEDSNSLLPCIFKILFKYFREENSLTFVDMKFKDDNILKSLNRLNITSIVNRSPNVKLKFLNMNYLLAVNNLQSFKDLFPCLTKEAGWNPIARFLIVFQSLEAHQYREVLDMLLKYHVINIIFVNGTTNPSLHTYNPFENYGCGKYYTRIIHFGKCSNNTHDLYPEKLVTGLRNCIFNISATHWPPFSIDPAQRVKGMASQGVEQYVMETIAEMEQFKVNFTYNFDAEKFSIVTSDMSVSGPMEMLQNNKTDVMLGGLLLYRARAIAFSYLYGHLDHIDDIKIVVKKAPLLETWKLFYMEFEPLVWLCIFLSFVMFSIVMIVLLQAQDKSKVVLQLIDSLIMHGHKIRYRSTVKCVFAFWLWFTFLINCFYQSNLVSLTTTPTFNEQISIPKHLVQYNLRPCVSPVMFKFVDVYGNGSGSAFAARTKPACKKLLKSLNAVSNSKHLYTITLNSIYMYYKHLFYDQWGQPLLYSFRRPISNAVYAIYMYKGFPMHYRINKLTLMLKENGLVQRQLEKQYHLRNLQCHYRYKGYEVRFVVPWYIYAFGCFVSMVAFVIESSTKM